MKRDLGRPKHKMGDNHRQDTEQGQEEYYKGCRGRLGARKGINENQEVCEEQKKYLNGKQQLVEGSKSKSLAKIRMTITIRITNLLQRKY